MRVRQLRAGAHLETGGEDSRVAGDVSDLQHTQPEQCRVHQTDGEVTVSWTSLVIIPMYLPFGQIGSVIIPLYLPLRLIVLSYPCTTYISN